MKVIKLKIRGMTCLSCSASVERLVSDLEGLISQKVSHKTDSGEFMIDENLLTEEELIKRINQGHYKVDLPEKENLQAQIEIPKCPICNKSGLLVPNSVFKSNLKQENLGKINLEAKNYICLNPSCSVAYYSKNKKLTIDKSELKRELWFKNGIKRKIICYCNNIDTEQIEKAVNDYGLTTWEQVVLKYRSKAIEKCEILNPTGYCCRENFDNVVKQITKKEN
ncbi:cation transporter [Bacteroides graminisolvens]|jgi:Copper chaperone|uniref:cation transporter n=1 Tax=Bacteroides graminisolvens TaxID=477666 RepID=UPI0023F3DCE9|nr:cation transporter [Bacteroides graminisolvens]MDD3210876.1 cation transporter [Bacteroides graminisolvens]